MAVRKGNRAPGAVLALALLGLAIPTGAQAAYWAESGDPRLRHDLQLLADAGVLSAPVTAWPIPWGDIARDVRDRYPSGFSSPAVGQALLRVQRRARREARTGDFQPHIRTAVAEKPVTIRSFKDTPRESGEAEVGLEWMGRRFAFRLQGQAVNDPEDDQTYRPDGSYIGTILGNWTVSVDTVSRWWGPGWDGSLVLSNNARPVPKVAVQRNYADPFDLPVLSWLGPWRFSAFFGRLEHDRAVARVDQAGARLTFRPHRTLEIGMSQMALVGGENRPQSVQDAGYRLASADARFRVPVLPLAVYGQYAEQGSSETDLDPGGFTLGGAEGWLSLGRHGGSLRLAVEYTSTTTDSDTAGAAYASPRYPDGYRYQGRPIGHGLGGEGELWSVTGVWVGAAGRTVDLELRQGVLAKDQAGERDLDSARLGLTLQPDEDRSLSLDLGWRRYDAGGDAEGEFHGSVEIRRGF